MAKGHDLVIIGAGPNGLVAAGCLAKAGLRPLVLEARSLVGGRAVTEEIHPGFRCPTVAHGAGPLVRQVVRALEPGAFGLEWLAPPVRVLAPALEGFSLAIFDDPARTAAGLRGLSARDAAVYPEFAATLARMGRALGPLGSMTPPSTESLSGRDLWNLLRLGKRLRGLGKKDLYRILRWGPMSAADFVAEWFENDLLSATISARGIHGSFAGPRSPGTTAGILLQAAWDGQATAPALFPRGGLGALTAALAASARAAGAEIRLGAKVAHIAVKDGAATGVVLADGEEIAARAVVSGADPRTTFLELLDAAALGPGFVGKMRNYRCRGSAAKVNLALSRLPRWQIGPAPTDLDLPALFGGRIHIGPEIDYLERAYDAVKYGELSPRPMLDIAIPSLLDPQLAPPGAHVMSIHAQWVPHNRPAGDPERVANVVLDTLVQYAPDLREVVVGRQVLTPVELEAEYGLGGGHLLHGEPTLDQLFAFRPLPGWAQYRTPIAGLYLCGAGTHPGGVINGASGANASREILRDLRN